MELTEKIKCVQLFKGFSCDEVSYICISIIIYYIYIYISYIIHYNFIYYFMIFYKYNKKIYR